MRETKYRAWERNLKEIIPVHNIDFEKKMINTESAWRTFEEIELLQYTGLKDKNGVEIFEDDVIEVRDELYPFVKNWIGIVKMNCGSYLIETLKDSDDNQHYEYLFNDAQEITVIGNVYKNPELMVVAE